jgi:hypothetical protein
MTILVRFSAGRILLHILAMLGDRSVRFHMEGIRRELPWLESVRLLVERARSRVLGALALYLAQPLVPCVASGIADPHSLAGRLDPGDVLLIHGNTRAAAIVERVTRSTWSHVSIYVGPLDDSPDPRCVVEADFLEGVRPIRLSEIKAQEICVLRPTCLPAADRRKVADWVIARIGCGYDLAHAARLLGRALWRRPLMARRVHKAPRITASSARRFICCSLLTHAFAWAGCPIVTEEARVGPMMAADNNIVPSDFEHASIFEIFQAPA